MLEFDTPSIITSNPSDVFPIPYLQPVIFDVTNRFVSKCFVISFTCNAVLFMPKLAGTTNISAKFSSTPSELLINFSKSKSKFCFLLLNNPSIPIIEFSSIL